MNSLNLSLSPITKALSTKWSKGARGLALMRKCPFVASLGKLSPLIDFSRSRFSVAKAFCRPNKSQTLLVTSVHSFSHMCTMGSHSSYRVKTCSTRINLILRWSLKLVNNYASKWSTDSLYNSTPIKPRHKLLLLMTNNLSSARLSKLWVSTVNNNKAPVLLSRSRSKWNNNLQLSNQNLAIIKLLLLKTLMPKRINRLRWLTVFIMSNQWTKLNLAKLTRSCTTQASVEKRSLRKRCKSNAGGASSMMKWERRTSQQV